MLGMVAKCAAFSMLGPFDSWQVPRIAYNPYGGDIGGPMNLGEEYRWNVKTLYYGFDSSFLNYFGTQGTNAVEQAIAVFNALTNVSAMSADLSEYPMDTLRINYQAQALNIIDLKSMTMAMILEELGVTSSERYTWTIRGRRDNPVLYSVIKRNFDPVTLQPSSYVNGVLFTYLIQEFQNPDVADALEIRVDPLQLATTVADTMGGLFPTTLDAFYEGAYFTGLTRDDVGALRYLYRPDNYNIETLPANTFAQAGAGSPWVPVGSTSGGGTVGVNQAIRPGVDKITFVRGNYDSLIGSFIATTNIYTDYYVSNSVLRSQTVARAILQPDFLFLAQDLGVAGGFAPVATRRTDTGGWINNSGINSQAALAGPGQITSQVDILFSQVGPYFLNAQTDFLDEFNNVGDGFAWGLYDGTTNTPVVFPNGASIFDLEQQILYGGFAQDGTPWTVPDSFIIVTNTP